MCLIFEIFQTTKQLYNHVQCGHRKRHSEFNHQTPGINPGKNLGGHNMFHHLLPQTDLLSYMTIVYPGSQLRFQSGPNGLHQSVGCLSRHLKQEAAPGADCIITILKKECPDYHFGGLQSWKDVS